ncbi:hypothetical protein FT081_22410 [Salmonella enterica subsp. enterica]|nr:hypothetical protein [Salmonella enterica subsp. enterica serovar Limete]
MKFRTSAICDLMGISRRQLDRRIKAGSFPLADDRDAKGYWWEGERVATHLLEAQKEKAGS